MTLAGLPHSEISGSMRACRSPKHIAACHVLHRLSVPRHPPSTLSNLTIKCLDLMRSAVRCLATPLCISSTTRIQLSRNAWIEKIDAGRNPGIAFTVGPPMAATSVAAGVSFAAEAVRLPARKDSAHRFGLFRFGPFWWS